MKTLLIALATGSLMLAACSSSKPAEEAAAPRVTVEEAMTQCQQASGENADRAVFDACMKDKGYQRTAESAASEPVASEPVAAPEAVAPEAAASEPAAGLGFGRFCRISAYLHHSCLRRMRPLRRSA